MKKFIPQLINSITIATMGFFAIPKLLGKAQSVAGFEQFESVIGLNAEFFRIFTGISELGLAITVLIFAVSQHKTLGQLAFAFLLITMITALGLEFFARPEPKMLLVIIAIVLAFFSLLQLKELTSSPKKQII